MTDPLTHLDDEGAARMVDVGDKEITRRTATARAVVRMSPDTLAAVLAGDAPKGDVIGTARLAGIQAAKRTAELIPLCHVLALDNVDVTSRVEGDTLVLEATAAVTARTGVEMEAMTAAAVAALTIYDMVKGIERGVMIESIQLIAKSGGRSGDYRRD